MRLQGLAFLLVAFSAIACGTAATDSTGSGSGGRGGSGSGGSGGTTGGSGGSSGGDGAACPTFNYTNYNPTMSPTLRNDVQPIFSRGCALASSCHQLGGSHHPFLGLSLFQLDGGKMTDAMLETVISEVKDKPSTQVAGRSLLVAGKPEDSYLMNKIEGTHDCSGFVCMGPDKCGLQMPGPPPDASLSKSEIELIRAWIKKGAPL